MFGAPSATADFNTPLEEKGEELFRGQFNLLAQGHHSRANIAFTPCSLHRSPLGVAGRLHVGAEALVGCVVGLLNHVREHFTPTCDELGEADPLARVCR